MTTIRTVADPRVVAEQGVVLNQYVGPLNWEHYKIPASGLSNTQITFANLVTLGTNRIYDSNFQIEYTITVDLSSSSVTPSPTAVEEQIRFHPFPLHWVCDQLRTNINGAACMVRPQESLMQRMMYWRQHVIDKTCNFCPHTKAPTVMDSVLVVKPEVENFQGFWNFQKKYGKYGSQNVGTPLSCVAFNYDYTSKIATITFREPLLCPPFNQRLDEIYQHPLFNVTSIDIVFQLNDLRKMLEASVATDVSLDSGTQSEVFVTHAMNDLMPSNVTINITSAQLCFNVASMPTGMTVPPILQLPYYDNVCYVTNGNVSSGTTGDVVMTSGVYTLAQVPTAIYVFVSENQLYRSGGAGLGSMNYDCSLCPIRDINITLGNNTQLLNTTSEYDRYQMALANGLEDVTWEEFTRPILTLPYTNVDAAHYTDWGQGQRASRCILRLIPGVDLLIPDKRLVGGSDAEQMVFQVRLTTDVTGVPVAAQPYLALWVMFEYCGVLTIEPVHASIDMMPIKGTPPPPSAPDVVADTSVDAASGGGEGTNPTGAGIFDFLKNVPVVGNIVSGVKAAVNSNLGRKVISFLGKELMDEPPPAKVPKVTGGTIIGGDVLGKFYQ